MKELYNVMYGSKSYGRTYREFEKLINELKNNPSLIILINKDYLSELEIILNDYNINFSKIKLTDMLPKDVKAIVIDEKFYK